MYLSILLSIYVSIYLGDRKPLNFVKILYLYIYLLLSIYLGEGKPSVQVSKFDEVLPQSYNDAHLLRNMLSYNMIAVTPLGAHEEITARAPFKKL